MKLAVFADGTWNRIENGTGTNVVKLSEAAFKNQEQVTFYDEGVGVNTWEKIRGGLFGLGISQNIKDCYGFIVEQWKGAGEAGHELFLFGFSRGAYTVRSLAGLLGRIGLVRTRADIDEAYDLYRKAKEAKNKAAIERFQQARVLCKPQITMIGVWDTVGALGIPLNVVNRLNPFPHRFHDTSLGPRVAAAFHAVAVDERREAYVPTLWDPLPAGSSQVLEQVFFPGAHSDVGGKYQDDARLGDITLEWMAHHARRRGLRLDEEKIPRCPIEYCYGKLHFPMKYVPIRRAPREIRHGRISGAVRRRWDAPAGACNPHPYVTANLEREGKYEWHQWPEDLGA